MSAVETPVAGDVPYVPAVREVPICRQFGTVLWWLRPPEGWSNTAYSVFYGYGVPPFYVS